MNLLKKYFNLFLDIIFPRKRIEKQIRQISPLELFNLGNKTTHEDKRILTIFDYKDPLVRQSLWSLKYRGDKSMAKILAQILYDEILEKVFELEIFYNFKDPILIPIPISKKKFKTRGYNQCELIARELEELSDDVLTLEKKILIKVKETIPQSRTKNKKQRLENIKNCFAVKNREHLEGRNVILLDDITTTGATLTEAKKVLKKHGANKIICVTVAH